MAHCQSIQELRDKVDAVDEAHRANAREVEGHHPHGQTLDGRPMKLLPSTTSTGPVGDCDDCNEPVFRVIDNGRFVDHCRECINANRRLSLTHEKQIRAICLKCTLIYDSFGLVQAAHHQHGRDLEDALDTDKVTIVPGLISLIASGLVEIDDDTGEVTLNC